MGHVIAFIPASGGVGASTLAAAVAVRAAGAGREAVAVDLDHVAGRLDVVFGVEQQAGWRWDALAEVIGVVDGAALAQRLPCSEGVRVLAHDRALALAAPEPPSRRAGDNAGHGGPGQQEGHGGVAVVVADVVADVVSGLAQAHEVTVLDLSRDVAVLEAVAGLVDVVVLVVGSQLLQVASASASTAVLKAALRELPWASTSTAWSCPPPQICVVLRGASVSDELADVVVDHLDLPLAGIVGDEHRVVSDLERGIVPGARGRGSLVDVADDLLLRLVSAERAA
ncbi:hypothetical protein BA895_00940 [Humibacillus sp. DSM 29435]|uniref:hypothetical protein n=1 Tax=Humibacillus sp. DSM 29435 TaxID=1869167 RepID=UPI000872E7D8|nr:hypothetical protein [Humibacillus sp. DSM 29435]OFE18786.1 hypothetical protein BA895_00940 [Humibacillus sp. DSM 29435]